MERIEYRTIDKSLWPRGPWDDEPDKVQWQDEATGLPCLIVRGPVGALCGYVGVAEGHPMFGRDYDETYAGKFDLDAHGGLTFAGHCHPGDESKAICHKPAPGEPDHVWWLGFDCAHSGDLCPSVTYIQFAGDKYRSILYVEQEIRNLASQLAAMR